MRVLLFFLLAVLLPAAAHAVDVRLEVRPGVASSAEYLPGQRGKPVVLLLHGFLQTRDFPTVATLGRGLRDAGYGVLVPTLSLGIPDRKQSLACEAVHTHSLDDDVAEIGRWVSWLKSQNHRSIVLAGHSFGSLQLLAYLADRPDPAVKAYIGASLIEAQIRAPRRAQLIARLEHAARTQPDVLIDGQLTYCNRYPSTPRALLSYVRWDQAHTLAALTHAPVKTGLIMGEADYMVGGNWLKALKHVRTPLAIVKGANHFMDGQHELDLLDHTLYFLGTFKLDGT